MMELGVSVVLVLFSVFFVNKMCVSVALGAVLTFMSLFNLYQSHGSVSVSGIFIEDGVSSTMVVLTFYICFMMLLVKCRGNTGIFVIFVFLLNLFLLLAFGVNSLLWFYVFFEASLVPILFMIISWGSQPERLQAGMSMIIYTMSGSLPFLMMIFYFRALQGHSVLYLCVMEDFIVCGYHWIFLLVVFLIKLPIFSFHMWLPKAHVEAPLSGSMVLAAILLKLGGYGMLRTMNAFSFKFYPFMMVVVVVGLFGGSVLAIQCLRQLDVKSLIAYSSVCHMSLVLCGILSNCEMGWKTAILSMVAHGFCSSGLFVLVNMCYEKMGSRSLLVMGGMFSSAPYMMMFLFLFGIINSGVPPFLNFYGEIFTSLVVFYKWPVLIILVSLLLFFSFAYNMYLYVSVSHGKHHKIVFLENNFIYYISMFMHFFPLMLFMWLPNFLFCM